MEQEIISASMSRSPSASPSTSVFRERPKRKKIVIRGNCSIEAFFFTATSPGRVTEPPPLKPSHQPLLGDLLFNKFPTASETLRNAQVWMWTDPNSTGQPSWEDITETYGLLTEPLTHPLDKGRYLLKNAKDGTPSWVTSQTFDSHVAKEKEAREGD